MKLSINGNSVEVSAQLMSAVVYGLSAALHGQITFKDGRPEQSNFHDYPVMRLNEAPVVETHLINSGAKMGGIGRAGHAADRAGVGECGAGGDGQTRALAAVQADVNVGAALCRDGSRRR
jgi:hypothetical protein